MALDDGAYPVSLLRASNHITYHCYRNAINKVVCLPCHHFPAM